MENNESLKALDNWDSNNESTNFFNEVKEETSFVGYKEDTTTDVQNTFTGTESLTEDLKNFSKNRINEMKDSLLETVFSNELNAFYQENKRMMNHSERNRTLHALEKMIAKKQIYVNEIGQIVVRKGSNVTPPNQKKKKRKK